MANVNISTATYAANGSVDTAAADAVILTNFTPAFGITVGVFKGETGTVMVSVNPALSEAPGNANGGEPAFDGKDVFVPAEALQNAKSNRIFVRSTSGTVNYWVTAV